MGSRGTLCAILAALAFMSFGQAPSDTIEIRHTFFGPSFRLGGQVLTPKELFAVTKTNPEAWREMRMAQRRARWMVAFGVVAATSVFYALESNKDQESKNWNALWVAAGALVITIPVGYSYNRHAVKGAQLYNHGIRSSGSHASRIYLNWMGQGVSVRYVF